MTPPSVRTPSAGAGGISAGGVTAGGTTAAVLGGPAPLAPSGGVQSPLGAPMTSAGAIAQRPLLAARTRRALAHGRLTQRELEQTVATLRHCLGQLTATERRVLIMRAGLGPRRALSRAQVARRLDLSLAQTGRIERRALRRLGAFDGAGRCVAAGGGAARAGLLAFGGAAGMVPAALASDAAGTPRSGIEGVSASGGGDHGSSLGSVLPSPLGGGSDWTLLILLMAAAIVALLVRRELRRQHGG